jgi:threonine dehydrogenase-like Zn-dependent dehydrogenase
MNHTPAQPARTPAELPTTVPTTVLTTMAALIVTDDGPRFVTDRPVPTPGPGEALVRVLLAGICSTDLHILQGYKGGFRGVLGHEFVGRVAHCPEAPAWEGQRVVAEINIGCGNCDLCAEGLHKHCRRRAALGILDHDGVFADYVCLPIANLHAVPNDLADDAAVFAEPLAAALQIGEQVALHPKLRTYVLGDGRLGQLIAQAMALSCPDTTLIGRTPAKLAIAAAREIATATLDDLERLRADPAHVVVEATGSPQGLAIALDLVRPAGTLVLKSTFADLITADLSHVAVDEITIVGSRCGPFAPALAHLQSGRVDPTPLISARFPLARAVDALAYAAQRGVLKVLLEV